MLRNNLAGLTPRPLRLDIHDAKSHLRIPNQIAAAIENEEVGNADNFDLGSTDCFLDKKGRPIQDWNFICDGVRSLFYMLVERVGSHRGMPREYPDAPSRA